MVYRHVLSELQTVRTTHTEHAFARTGAAEIATENAAIATRFTIEDMAAAASSTAGTDPE
jgi:hypothetical protein